MLECICHPKVLKNRQALTKIAFADVCVLSFREFYEVSRTIPVEEDYRTFCKTSKMRVTTELPTRVGQTLAASINLRLSSKVLEDPDRCL